MLPSSTVEAVLWSSSTNKHKLFLHSVNYQHAVCVSLRSNKHAECISLLILPLPAVAVFLGALLPPVYQSTGVKSLAGMCITSPAWMCLVTSQLQPYLVLYKTSVGKHKYFLSFDLFLNRCVVLHLRPVGGKIRYL